MSQTCSPDPWHIGPEVASTVHKTALKGTSPQRLGERMHPVNHVGAGHEAGGVVVRAFPHGWGRMRGRLVEAA